MKKIFLVFTLITLYSASYSQLGDLMKRASGRAKAKAIKKADDKVDQQVDKALDETTYQKHKTESGDNSQKKLKEQHNIGSDTMQPAAGKNVATEITPVKDSALESYSKSDFIPGEMILAFEDFNETEIGDYPAQWNINGSAEVVTLNRYSGKWLKISNAANTSFIPEFISQLPADFTLEFDFIYKMDLDKNLFTHFLTCVLTQANKPDEKIGSSMIGNYGMRLTLASGIAAGFDSRIEQIAANTYGSIDMRKTTGDFSSKNAGKIFHVSLWRQHQRLRVYINGNKVFDIPRLLNGNGELNQVRFFASLNGPDDAYFLSNIRLAAGLPDTRNKLITDGKWTTRGILFDVNSDVIRGESYAVLKEIAQVLEENSSLRIKITGHTDSDGSDRANQVLSEKRAAAVKKALINQFNIDVDRLETEGKGESAPVDTSNTREARANNRRVEFTKIK